MIIVVVYMNAIIFFIQGIVYNSSLFIVSEKNPI